MLFFFITVKYFNIGRLNFIFNILLENFNWLAKPDFMSQYMMPKVPQKYRVVCDVTGYSPNSIKTEIKGRMLWVHGKEETKLEGGDFSCKEFKRTYELPIGA